MNIYNKLSEIQKNLIAPKGQRNDFGKYNYRSCEDIVKALKPLLDENNCVCFMTNEMEQIGDRIYVKAIVKLIDLESGESIVTTAHAREEQDKKGMDGSQITGASSSYARKYALSGLFMIDNENDSDVTDTQEKLTEEKSPEKKATKKQVEILGNVYKGDNLTKLLEAQNIKKLEDLSMTKASELISKIKGENK